METTAGRQTSRVRAKSESSGRTKGNGAMFVDNQTKRRRQIEIVVIFKNSFGFYY
jgi:hypothetical protein